jgi:hypothetical protein
MFKKITLALLASTLLAVSVLAQNTNSAARVPASHPATTVKPTISAPANVKIAKVTKVKKHKVKKHKIAKHHTRHIKHVKHVKPINHPGASKRVFNAASKQSMPSHNN